MKILLSLIQLGRVLVVFLILAPASMDSYGQSIANVLLADAKTGDEIKLSQSNISVAIFYCNSCPYSSYYINRIKTISKRFGSVQFVLINSSPDSFNDKESIAEMKNYVSSNSLQIPYLIDKDQEVLTSLGATKCPEAFVLEKSGDQLNVVYHGAIDDNPQVESQVKVKYLEEAITRVLAGQTPLKQYVRPQGCVIKKN